MQALRFVKLLWLLLLVPASPTPPEEDAHLSYQRLSSSPTPEASAPLVTAPEIVISHTYHRTNVGRFRLVQTQANYALPARKSLYMLGATSPNSTMSASSFDDFSEDYENKPLALANAVQRCANRYAMADGNILKVKAFNLVSVPDSADRFYECRATIHTFSHDVLLSLDKPARSYVYELTEDLRMPTPPVPAVIPSTITVKRDYGVKNVFTLELAAPGTWIHESYSTGISSSITFEQAFQKCAIIEGGLAPALGKKRRIYNIIVRPKAYECVAVETDMNMSEIAVPDPTGNEHSYFYRFDHAIPGPNCCNIL